MSFRPGDSKREEFRKYLEKAGLLDALTKVLVHLYNESEKPADAIQYLKDYLNVSPDPTPINQEIEELRKEIASLRLENEQLKVKAIKHEETEAQDSPNNED